MADDTEPINTSDLVLNKDPLVGQRPAPKNVRRARRVGVQRTRTEAVIVNTEGIIRYGILIIIIKVLALMSTQDLLDLAPLP